MEAVLWYVLTGTRGGPNRVRLLRAIDERPRNANQLAEDLDLDYTTIRHHLDVLAENGMVESSGDDYGAIYLILSVMGNSTAMLDSTADNGFLARLCHSQYTYL